MDKNAFPKWLLVTTLIMAGCSDDAQPQSQQTQCVPSFEGGWVRMGPAAMPMMAGFGRIENDCSEPIYIVGASSPQFDEVSLHRTVSEAGISRMRPVPRLEVDAGTSTALEPGGLHLMLMQPRQPLQEGGKVSVTLTLEDGADVAADLVVQRSAP